jgi:sirohydrochlorin cobaltochelatase
MTKAVVLLGHGSKSQEAKEDFEFIVKLTQEKLAIDNVFGAHMEIAEPSLEDVISKISETELNRVIIIPYFLYKGNHIKFDIPKKIAKLEQMYPNLSFEFGTPIGKDPFMADLLAKKVMQMG